ncbi:MAG: sel1 repeat family protein [Proteobacteria bacterium]|nr:sel1 repeat family protein [Pseudomonadota bacterium]NOG59729.1 sel1 repeat family protein [Pseudomonadota bacterium]
MIILCLLLLPSFVSAEDDKPQFTDEQLARLKQAEVEYKDNPAKMKLLNHFKEKLGISDEPVEEIAAPPPLKHITSTEGSMDSANAAYAKGDYTSALEQYKAMAAQGNQEANIYVGMMYEAGMGAEADKATAQAWYKRASETPTTDYNNSKLVNDKTTESYGKNRLTAEEIEKSELINQEINDEINRVNGVEYRPIEISETGTHGASTKNSMTNSISPVDLTEMKAIVKQKSALYINPRRPRTTLFIPEKLDEIQHTQPEKQAKYEYYQPEKFIREAELNKLEKS